MCRCLLSRLSGLCWGSPAARGADDQTLLCQEGHEVRRAGRLGEFKWRYGLMRETRGKGERRQDFYLNCLVVFPCSVYLKRTHTHMHISWLTLEGEPRMVGRGLRCISSLSLGEECSGRTVIRPVEGATTGSECCFLIFCLTPPLAHSSKQGALWSRVPSPVACGCWWEAGRASAWWGAVEMSDSQNISVLTQQVAWQGRWTSPV